MSAPLFRKESNYFGMITEKQRKLKWAARCLLTASLALTEYKGGKTCHTMCKLHCELREERSGLISCITQKKQDFLFTNPLPILPLSELATAQSQRSVWLIRGCSRTER